MPIRLQTPKKPKPAKIPRKASGSKPEELLALQIRMSKIPAPDRELRFHATRKWRFDFAWPDYKLAVEVHGAIWCGKSGGHTSGKGRMRDMEKNNEASLLGWVVLEVSDKDIKNGHAIELLRRGLENAKRQS